MYAAMILNIHNSYGLILNINSIAFTNDCCILLFAEGTIARSEFLDMHSLRKPPILILYTTVIFYLLCWPPVHYIL